MRAWLALLALLLGAPLAWAEPKDTYTEIVSKLRHCESNLGLIERKVDRVKNPTTQDWDATTQALTRMEATWRECQARLDAVKPPKYEKLWSRAQAMLTSQKELALTCGYAVELRYQLWNPKGAPPGVSEATLEAVKKQLPALRESYQKASAEASRDR